MLVSLIWLLAGRAYLEAVVTRLFMHLFPLGNETAGLTITGKISTSSGSIRFHDYLFGLIKGYRECHLIDGAEGK
jgi:hypothetical protein